MTDAPPLRVTYLLEQTDQTDAVHLALAQADALTGAGHEVRIVTAGLPVTWRPSRAEWVFVDDLGDYRASAGESLVREDKVAELGTIVDEEFFRERLPRDNDPLRVLLVGESQDEASGIRDGYGAAAHARWFHQTLELVRLSAWVPSREEPLDAVQEFHVGLTTTERRRLMHSCDLLLAPDLREERFRLHVAEALAAGLPCVLTSTAPHRSFDASDDYARFAREGNAVELGEKLLELLESGAVRDRLRQRGREVAGRWRAAEVLGRLEAFFRG